MALGFTLAQLLAQFPRAGKVEWIGVRPERRSSMLALDNVLISDIGLAGDHRTRAGPRAVTLIQAEHLPAIASLAGLSAVAPDQLRRNFVVSGINLLALKDKQFRIGTAVLQGTGICAPCSRMEEELGQGGYNAVRGHGGITAKVISEGTVSLGDDVCFIK